MGRRRTSFSPLRWLMHSTVVLLGAAALTFLFFLTLPLIQAITKTPEADTIISEANTIDPPEPPEQVDEPEPEPEEEEKPPELTEDAPPMDLAQLDLALNAGTGGGWGAGNFGAKLSSLVTGGGAGGQDELFSARDLDQTPRATVQVGPEVTPAIRRATKAGPGKVYVLFIVDSRGKVRNPRVQKSSDPIFEKAAVNAVKKWKFEPGKRKGKPVRFRMRVPITFPQGL